jgi:restriction system protein
MARRRYKKEEGLIEILLRSPWQVSAVFAVVVFLFLGVLVPSFLYKNPVTQGLGALSHGAAPFVAGFFALIALGLYITQRKERVVELPPPIWQPPPSNSSSLQNHSWGSQASQDNVREAWEAVAAKASPTPEPVPTEWSLGLLRSIEWKRFEILTAAYFQEKTFRTELLPPGPDGGIDVKLFMPNSTEPYALVQCKAWNSQRVGVAPVRELLGVLAHQKVGRGIFVTTNEYSTDAIAFAQGCAINLISGEMLLKGILALSSEQQKKLLAVATEGDYKTPTCPSCGIKMVEKSGKRGAFWGCRNFPGCRQVFRISSAKR